MSTPFTVLVTGGDEVDNALICRSLDTLLDRHANLIVLHAAGSRSDYVAERWATDRGRPYIGIPPALGGTERDHHTIMLWYLPSGVVAFPGADVELVRRAEADGLKVWRVA